MKDQARIAVTSRSFSRHPILRAELQAIYDDVRFNNDGNVLEDSELIKFLQDRDKVIIALEKISSSVLAELPDLKVISKYGVGVDMLDLPAMAARGIQLGWTGGVNRRSVSELVITFAISLLRRIPEVTAGVRAGNWCQTLGRQISQRCFGIVGCGHVGKDLGRLLRAFGCRVLSHDIRNFPAYSAETGIEAVDLDTLLRTADIISLHLPLNQSTRGILSQDKLALLPEGSLLINTARGGLVDETAVKNLLKQGHLAGAAFDVLEQEPPHDLELVRMPNVIVTPHIGGNTEEAILSMGRAAISGLEDATLPKSGTDYWKP